MIKYATQNTVGVGVTRLPIFLFKFYVSWYSIKVLKGFLCKSRNECLLQQQTKHFIFYFIP